jgi:hypothetical protein
MSDGKVLVVGGSSWQISGIIPRGASPAAIPPEIYECDPASHSWFAVAPLSAPRGFVVAVAIGTDHVLAIGGTSSPAAPTDAVELFSIS